MKEQKCNKSLCSVPFLRYIMTETPIRVFLFYNVVMANNVAGKLLTDAVAIGATVLAGIFTAGIASPIVATGARIVVGATINQAFDIFVNGKIDAKEFAKNIALAGISVGTAKVMRGVQEKVLSSLGHDDMNQVIGRTSNLVHTAGMVKNSPLKATFRLLQKIRRSQAAADASMGITENAADIADMQMDDLAHDSDFMALNKEDRQKVENEVRGMEDKNNKKDMSDKNSSDGNEDDMTPITVKFLLKPDVKGNHMKKMQSQTASRVEAWSKISGDNYLAQRRKAAGKKGKPKMTLTW